MNESKRLFFGMEVVSPWPDQLPQGRILLDENRHLTLAFLGNIDLSQIQSLPSICPQLPFILGPSGYFDRLLFLPSAMPQVAAWHIHWLEQKEGLLLFQQKLTQRLIDQGFLHGKKSKEFLSHVTIARAPFSKEEWEASFVPLPCFVRNLNLYESLGHSTYKVIWQRPVLAPFEEKEHTADIAWIIRGETVQQIYSHAKLAIAFQEPGLLKYLPQDRVHNLDQIVRSLNRMLGEMDIQEGSPFKAVSYHGALRKGESNLLEWEMIVDV